MMLSKPPLTIGKVSNCRVARLWMVAVSLPWHRAGRQ